MADLVDDAHHRRRELLGAVGLPDGDRDVRLDAAELLEEVDVEIGAAEFAVGDRLQAGVLLHLHDLGDRAILDRAQLRRRDLAARLLLARLEQVFRAQEAADVIGAERRCLALAHGIRPRESCAPRAGSSCDLTRSPRGCPAGVAATRHAEAGRGPASSSIIAIMAFCSGVEGRCAEVTMASALLSCGWTMVRACSRSRRRGAVQRARRQHREAVPLGHELQDRRHGVDLHRDLSAAGPGRRGGSRPACGSHGDGWG